MPVSPTAAARASRAGCRQVSFHGTRLDALGLQRVLGSSVGTLCLLPIHGRLHREHRRHDEDDHCASQRHDVHATNPFAVARRCRVNRFDGLDSVLVHHCTSSNAPSAACTSFHACCTSAVRWATSASAAVASP